MKKFLHSYPNIIIGTLAILFLVALIVFYFWAVDDVFADLRLGLSTPPPQGVQGFDLTGAEHLRLSIPGNGTPPISTQPVQPIQQATSSATSTGQ